ncbi:ACP S-malonyltransferase [Sandaracinobacteroides sp. A072]|uniref:ACP S-malonyltransferase n=1 Tax=Sandaracinobacteroides sp. A072 TaxID=3461146 RepID=UPI0040417AD0
MGTAFIFPGQGSQAVGMGKALADASAAARQTLQEVDEALGQSLSRLMFEGPEDALTLTSNAQPAIMAASIAALHVLEQDGNIRLADKAALVSGHSLGEYSALAAAGVFTLADTARLLRTRGDAMQAAVAPGEGAMAALLGLDRDAVEKVVADALAAGPGGEVLAAANDNAPGQVVISGHKTAVDRAIDLAKAAGARRAMPLAVSAPFHCALMQPAADVMAEALGRAAMQAPLVPLVANVTAASVTDVESIRRLLVEQVTATVRWRESVEAMAGLGITRMVEFGGKVLGPMVKRIAPDIECLSVAGPADIDAVLKAL